MGCFIVAGFRLDVALFEDVVGEVEGLLFVAVGASHLMDPLGAEFHSGNKFINYDLSHPTA